jgi:glycerol-3-phosphate acyltransferase PlsX
MKIAIDAMGGDFAPREIVQGSILALHDSEIKSLSQNALEIILVGQKDKIQHELSLIHKVPFERLSILNASEIVEMDESPAQACKQKKDSSIIRCCELVGQHTADACISAGNSGATMAASLITCGRLEGVLRPAIVTIVPTTNGVSVLVDAGANVDCKPKHLLQFAIMGDVFAQTALNFKNPRIGLLSIGEEESKGNDLIFKTQELLKKASINYIGNVEGRDIVNGQCDVIVCDGFVGNVALKAIEGVGELVFKLLSKELHSNLITLIGTFLAAPAFRRFKRTIDYREYGGAPLLGINGLSMITHGKSNAFAIKNAVRATLRSLNKNITHVLGERILAYGQEF